MTHLSRLGRAFSLGAILLATTQMAAAANIFDAPAPFEARVMVSGENRAPLYAGGTAEVSGRGFMPGQVVTLERGDSVLVEGLVADDKGEIAGSFALPADAVIGVHPVVVKTDGPDSAAVVDVKVSPKIDYFGQDAFNVRSVELGGGLYQVGVSDANGTLFVTSSAGRAEIESKLLKLDAKTLEVIAETTPPMSEPQGDRPASPYAVYGVGVDDANGTVWVTNTRHNTIAVYRQDDLSLVKQFPEGTATHSRDVLIDAARNRAYVSVADGVLAFDAKTLEPAETYTIPSGQRGASFAPMSLALDPEDGALYTVSRMTSEAAKIDLASGEITVMPLDHAVTASGVDVSDDGGLIFVASQGSDDLKILDAAGKELHDVLIGAQPLNVVYVDAQKLAYVANRASDSVAVVSAEGELVASLPGGPFPNFVEEGADGVVFMVNKARGDAAGGNSLWRIERK